MNVRSSMQLKDYMEVIGYRVTEGSEFCWNCFGNNAYRLDSWSGAWRPFDDQPYSISIVFDLNDQTVYQLEAHDYNNERSYRWTNPDYVEAHDKEVEQRGIDGEQAYDDVQFINLENVADLLQKARAIVAGEEYDTRVTMDVELDEDVMFELMKRAHERDMTLNDLINDVLSDKIKAMDGLQYQIDELMFEYCPSEMSKEQLDNWAKHQRPVDKDTL